MDNKLLLSVNFLGVDKLSGSIKNIVGAGKSGAQVLKGMKAEARGLERKLADVRKQIAGGAGNLTSLINRERELAIATNAANIKLATQTDHFKRISQINAKVSGIAARGDAMKSAGTNNIMSGAGLAAPLILATKGAAEFQDGMIDIALKANLTAKEAVTMQRQIMAAAAAAKQLPEDMRRGVDTLAGFGLDSRKAVQIVQPIGKFVTAYRADMAEVSQATFAGIDNLKIPLTQTTKMLDVMAFAGKAGAFEAKDLAASMPSLSAAYQGVGQSGITAFAQLTAGAEIARKGAGDSATAGNNLLNLLNKLGSKETLKNFSEAGIDLEKALKNSKDPLETIVMLANKATGGDTFKLNKLFQDAQVLGALRPLMKNLPEYRKMRDEALAATGVTDADFARRSQGAGANWSALMGNLQRLSITAGSLLLPTLVKVTGQVGSVLQKVADWADANPKLAGGIMQAVAYLAMFKVGLGAVQYVFGSLLSPLSSVIGLLGRFQKWGGFLRIFFGGAAKLQAVGPIFVRAFGMIRTAAIFLAQGFMRAGIMMLANPVILIIVAIIAVVGLAAYLIYKNWDTIKAAFVNAWGVIRTSATAGWAWLKGAFMAGMAWLGGLPGRFLSFGQNMMQGLVNGIKAGVGWVKDAIFGLVGKVKSWFTNPMEIQSPSRLFMGYGGYITKGLAMGLDQGAGAPLKSMSRIAAGLGTGMAVGFASPAMAGAGTSPAQQRGGAAAAMSVTYNVTINLTGADASNPKGAAMAIKRELDALLAVEQRGAYDDV